MVENIIAPLIASLATAALIGISIVARRWMKRRSPLTGTGEVLIPKAWELALPTAEALPSDVPEAERAYVPLYRLLRQRGAADFRMTTAKILVENRSEQPLTIINITVQREQVGDPFSAAWVRYPPAGAAEALVLNFPLDEDHPEAWSAAYEGATGNLVRTGDRPYFEDHVITLSPGESQSLLITGRAESVRCSWWLKIETSQAGRHKVVPVKPEGGAFLTSGTPASGFSHRWEWRWYDGNAARFAPPPEYE
ncbi:hypothetical protein [Streptomyces mangrovi]|uniref:hypothetical protein n=1 Tax=Streptomyces mangrovi TaxID=1206892 RepID=UPI00399C67CC